MNEWMNEYGCQRERERERDRERVRTDAAMHFQVHFFDVEILAWQCKCTALTLEGAQARMEQWQAAEPWQRFRIRRRWGFPQAVH